jgi:hypothetical protein
MVLFLAIIILIFFVLLAVVYYILPIFVQHRRLQKDYRNISLLPLSSIPFVGNVHQLGEESYQFFQLLCRLSKECQDQEKGLFNLWYTLWPMVFLCSGQGLEVSKSNYF